MNAMTEAEIKLQAMETELAAARQAAATSQQEVRELTDQLHGVNDEIARLNRELQENFAKMRDFQDELSKSSKLSELGRLTATIAHDIRNPLGSIRTSSFILTRQLKDGPEAALKPLERIKKGVDRCDVIINELLDYARSKTLQLETVSFDSWLLQTINEHKGDAIQAALVECNLGLADTEVDFDPSRMDRAFVNLMSNAVEAMVGKEGSLLENPTQNPKIVITTRQTDRGIEVSVTDNGPGISDEDMEKVFTPLFTTKSFGVGLGLSAVQKIFEEHGGGLEVTSTPGNGATFTGWFPQKQAQNVAA